MTAPPHAPTLRIERYALYGEIASGGMATVHFGRLTGTEGFSKPVAIKRLHPQFAKDAEFSSMLLDEGRLAARIQHPNVVSTLDVVASDGELFLVMEYVPGESVARLVRRARAMGEAVPLRIAAAVVCGALHGLHAAHEATNAMGESLQLVHRDVSPQNVLVGADGVAKVLDFGVAKAIGRSQMTRDGDVKGKLAYMAPEQLRRQLVDRRADIYAAGVVLWELLTCERLFDAPDQAGIVGAVLEGAVDPPSARVPGLPSAVDVVVMRALSRRATDRFATARQMALELEAACDGIASPAQVGEWVEQLVGETLAERAQIVSHIERASNDDGASAPPSAAIDSARASHPAPARASEAPSQVSTISVSMGASDTVRARRSRRATLAPFVPFAAGVVVAAVAFTGIAMRGRTPPGAPDAPAIADPAPPGSPAARSPMAEAPLAAAAIETRSASPPLGETRSASPPLGETRSASPPLGTASASDPPARTPTEKRKDVSKGRVVRRATPAARCAIGSYVDDAGIKHFFDGCAKAR